MYPHLPLTATRTCTGIRSKTFSQSVGRWRFPAVQSPPYRAIWAGMGGTARQRGRRQKVVWEMSDYNMSRIVSSVQSASGLPLGGMGAGTVEIRPDGHFHEWQIFNLGPWAPPPPAELRAVPPPMPPGAYSFFLRTSQPSSPPLVRRLGIRPELQDLYGLSFAQNVEAIAFDGRFPLANLEYIDPTLPVSVSSEMFSPFIPLDDKSSGTPGFYSVFHLKNTGSQPITVSLAAALTIRWHGRRRTLFLDVCRNHARAIHGHFLIPAWTAGSATRSHTAATSPRSRLGPMPGSPARPH